MQLAELRKYREDIFRIAQQCGISNIRVFGSTARGDADEESDVDFLVTVGPNVGFKFAGFALELEDLLHRKVDVISDRAINRHIEPYIMRDVRPL